MNTEYNKPKSEVRLMKGNEAIAHAAILYGCDGYFGYPITPQSEILETLEAEMPWETTGMVVLQAESEIASINMVYGGAATGKAVMTSSSSPGISLMQEGISYLAASELPALIVNVMRGGPGLGTIHPSQSDYFQATKGGGHGDYHLIVLAPSSVQEMADFVSLGFDLSFKYRTPSMILADGIVGQMMEKVVLPPMRPRRTADEIARQCPWAATGDPSKRRPTTVPSLELASAIMEKNNERFQETYRKIEKNEVRYQTYFTDDAEYLIVAFGSVARICLKAIEEARKQGHKIGLIRPITLWPFPYDAINEVSSHVKGILVVELNAGQMIEDVRLAVGRDKKVTHFGRMGGIIPNPSEILNALSKEFLNNQEV
ncbi:MAG: 3-methyl-2-oxobutanoate dehydrogenase subunit VorB [Muribaculaceae bacterium]|nr:3-methyl-2-oxobutanoate dehydrogenase subunit VorB [Muribaculaceae bacterium]